MASFDDILMRLGVHIRAAISAGGAALTKGDAVYAQGRAPLGDDGRARVKAYCEEHGCRAVFGRTLLGGVNLTLAAIK